MDWNYLNSNSWTELYEHESLDETDCSLLIGNGFNKAICSKAKSNYQSLFSEKTILKDIQDLNTSKALTCAQKKRVLTS